MSSKVAGKSKAERKTAANTRKKYRHGGPKGDTPAAPSQTNQPFEQDPKRRTGHFIGAGEPPLMKK